MPTVKVRARLEGGRRRAGRFWPYQPVIVDLDEATLAILRKDPQIAVSVPSELEIASGVSPVTTVEQAAHEVEALRAELAAQRAAHAADVDAKSVEVEALRAELAGLKAALSTNEESSKRKR